MTDTRGKTILNVMFKRVSAAFVIVGVSLATAVAQNGGIGSASSSWRNTPATPSGVIQRMEDAAVKLQDQAPIPRQVFYDIAYPADDEEFSALDGNALMLLTALSQSRRELPLQRVYVVLEDGTELPLRQVRLALSQQPISDSLVAKVFGRYRADALYLLPVYVRFKPVSLVVDFTGNFPIRVAMFEAPANASVSGLKVTPPTGVGPLETVIEAYIKREFPGFQVSKPAAP